MAAKPTKTKEAVKAAPDKAAGKASAKPEAKAAPAKGAKAAPPAPAAKAPAPVTVTLKQLSADLAERHEMPKKQADAMLADLFGQMIEHLKGGERLKIAGLGIIEVKNRAARMGRNPATGEAIQIKASKKVAFRAAKELKDAI